MPHIIMLIPTDVGVGLNSVILGLIHLIKQKGIRLNFFKPITQPFCNNKDQIATILSSYYNVQISKALKISYVKSLLANDQKDILMEEIVARYHESKQQAQVILIEGLIPIQKYPFIQSLNFNIAKTLGADIIFITTLNNNTPEQFKERIELFRTEFGGLQNKNISGVIINKINAPINNYSFMQHGLSEIFYGSKKNKIQKIDTKPLTDHCPLPVLGAIPWNFDLITIRGTDIANHLNASIFNQGALETRYIRSILFCDCSISNIASLLCPDSLIITPSDRLDVIVSVCLATTNGAEISALLLTGGYPVSRSIYDLCHHALENGLPVLTVDLDTPQTLLRLQRFKLTIHINDYKNIKRIQNHISLHINKKWIDSLGSNSKHSSLLSPPAFRYQLTKLAQKAKKCIVLPEGNEPRTIKAAVICAQKGIANCILLGEPNEINQVALSEGVKLGAGIEIIEPKYVQKNYVKRLVELRKTKGMTEILAYEQLKDNVVLGTMMLEKDEVDGLVSGAIHTTANTIRPPLQLIKTTPGISIVSSIFFMLFPEKVLVYADCAINPNPTPEQLSEIAIQSADSAKAFGIEPRVAMISYSTGNSAIGDDVEKVRKATHLAKIKRPDLLIDGPLQYDAAITEDVARYKAANSPVAGKASVFIFPDLNTGNTAYKAVQRSANLISIGPILQGMRKPVNDLSRGALVDDIVYTIAITAIQSTKNHLVTR